MQPETARTLLELNRRFYREFGLAFAATRRRVQPGVQHAALRLAQTGSWLDLGCGSGELARHLARTGYRGRYLGLDSSAELLGEAQKDLPGGRGFSVSYRQADLADSAWSEGLAPGGWNQVSCFAALHHLPGAGLRTRVLRQARLLLAEDGRFTLSVWQFQHSMKLLARRQPWARIRLSESEVEEGDALLDWRYALPGQAEEVGLRYVHLFSGEELARLAGECGFEIEEEFTSDGVGGKLGLYQIWRPAIIHWGPGESAQAEPTHQPEVQLQLPFG